jgi:hypothetical protein
MRLLEHLHIVEILREAEDERHSVLSDLGLNDANNESLDGPPSRPNFIRGMYFIHCLVINVLIVFACAHCILFYVAWHVISLTRRTRKDTTP